MSSSESESDGFNNDIDVILKGIESMKGYDSETRQKYNKIRVIKDETDEDFDDYYYTLKCCVTDFADVTKIEGRDKTYQLDYEIDITDEMMLGEDEEYEIEMSPHDFPYLVDPHDILPFMSILRRKKPFMKGVTIIINGDPDHEYKI